MKKEYKNTEKRGENKKEKVRGEGKGAIGGERREMRRKGEGRERRGERRRNSGAKGKQGSNMKRMGRFKEGSTKRMAETSRPALISRVVTNARKVPS